MDAKMIKKIEELEMKHWLERPYGAFIMTLAQAGTDKKYFKKVGISFNLGFNINLYQYPNIYYSSKLTRENQINLKKYLRKNNIFDISKLLAITHKKNKKELLNLLKNKKLSAKKKLIVTRELLRSYFPFLWSIMILENYYDERIIKEVPKYIKNDIDEFIGSAGAPEKLNAHGKMLADLAAGKPLKLVLKKYYWLKSRDGFSDFYTISELEDIKKNITKEEKHKVAIPHPLKKLCDELKELTFFRTDRTDKYYELMAMARPIFQEIADSMGVTFKELEDYDVDSIISGMPKKFPRPYSYLYINGKQILQSKPIINFSRDASKAIKGLSVFRGKAIGRVVIVRHASELEKVGRGNVLVSQMTFPAFISAMQKAVAFVTDEGGITCHAAIIAREMKKPCIVGTKNATEILKDGDLVEVNANRGVVRILKRN